MAIASKRAQGVVELCTGLARRRGLHGGAAQQGLDRQLLLGIERLTRIVVEGFGTSVDGGTSRPVAIPLALAMASQPMVCGTLYPMQSVSKRDLPITVSKEACARHLPLHAMEVADLGCDVDRRVALHLRQTRAMRWLWDQYGRSDEQELARRLLLGASQMPEAVRLRGGRLYALLGSQGTMGLHALYLPWLEDPDATDNLRRTPSFGRYADASLREALQRGLGLGQRDVEKLLDRGVCVIPRSAHHQLMDRDDWRSSGAAMLTGLAQDARLGARLVADLSPRSIRWQGWLTSEDGRVRLGDVESAFERMALTRVGIAIRLVYAALIARWWSGADHAVVSDDLELLDTAGLVRRAIAPLLRWSTSHSVAESIAHKLQVPETVAAAALNRLHERWRARADRWTRLPTAEDPWTPAGRLLDLLVRVIAVMENLLHRRKLALPHRDVFLLYMAHAIAGADELQLMPVDPDEEGIADATARELWPAWKALVDDTVADAVTA